MPPPAIALSPSSLPSSLPSLVRWTLAQPLPKLGRTPSPLLLPHPAEWTGLPRRKEDGRREEQMLPRRTRSPPNSIWGFYYFPGRQGTKGRKERRWMDGLGRKIGATDFDSSDLGFCICHFCDLREESDISTTKNSP